MTQTTPATANNTGLASKALLANLNISQSSGRKHDKKVTREIEEAHNAQHGEAGRFNKMLTSKEFLAGIMKTAGAARQYLYENTLPWGDNGDRLLPSANYFDFIAGMQKFDRDFYAEVDKAENTFSEMLIEAQKRLNGLFSPADYPNIIEFRSKFNFKTCFMPIPETADLRLDINQTEVNVLRQSIESEMNNRLTEAVSDTWSRIKDQLTKMKETLSDKDKIFRDSLFNNLKDIIALLPKLNVTNDSNINDICNEMQTLLVNPDEVRTNTMLRSKKAQEVNDLLNKFDSFFS